MDKDLVNNQIVSMRKAVRNCKRVVKQKLNKQIQRLELRLNKRDEPNPKLKNKIYNKRQELIAINGVNVDEVSKQALIQTNKYFDDIIRSSQSTAEAKALARTASIDIITKAVKRFKEDNPNCEQWLPSQIELWQQKKDLKRNKRKNMKVTEEVNDVVDNNSNKPIEVDIAKKVVEKSNTTNPKVSKISDKKKGNKEIKPKKNINEKVVKEIESKEEKVEEKKPKSDPFFLSKDSNPSDEESDNSTDSEDRMKSSKPTIRDKQQKRVKFAKPLGKGLRKPIQGKKQNFKSNSKSESKPMPKDKSPKLVAKANEASLHPSWAAKRTAKDKLKIDLNKKPMAKKIKFD